MKKNKKYLLIDNGHGLSLVNLTEIQVLFDLSKAEEKDILNFIDHSLGRECFRVYALLEEQKKDLFYKQLFDHQNQSDCSLLKKVFPQLQLRDITKFLRNEYLLVKGPEGFRYLTITGMNIPLSSFEEEKELLKFISKINFIQKEVFPDPIESIYAYVDEIGQESFVYPLFGHKVVEFTGFLASTTKTFHTTYIYG